MSENVKTIGDNSPINKISISEFREKGYLQELNRQFLHPMGLALEVIVGDDGNEQLGGIWDYREESEGIIYDLENSNEDRVERFVKDADFVESEIEKRVSHRMQKLGFAVEQIPRDKSFIIKKDL